MISLRTSSTQSLDDENRRIFDRDWIAIAPLEELAEPGSVASGHLGQDTGVRREPTMQGAGLTHRLIISISCPWQPRPALTEHGLTAEIAVDAR